MACRWTAGLLETVALLCNSIHHSRRPLLYCVNPSSQLQNVNLLWLRLFRPHHLLFMMEDENSRDMLQLAPRLRSILHWKHSTQVNGLQPLHFHHHILLHHCLLYQNSFSFHLFPHATLSDSDWHWLLFCSLYTHWLLMCSLQFHLFLPSSPFVRLTRYCRYLYYKTISSISADHPSTTR